MNISMRALHVNGIRVVGEDHCLPARAASHTLLTEVSYVPDPPRHAQGCRNPHQTLSWAPKETKMMLKKMMRPMTKIIILAMKSVIDLCWKKGMGEEVMKWEAFLSVIDEGRLNATAIPLIAEDRQKLSLWLQRTGWIEHLGNEPLLPLADSVHLPILLSRGGLHMIKILRQVQITIQKLWVIAEQSITHNSMKCTLALLRTANKSSSNLDNTPFKVLQETKTSNRYRDYWVSYILFCCRWFLESDKSYTGEKLIVATELVPLKREQEKELENNQINRDILEAKSLQSYQVPYLTKICSIIQTDTSEDSLEQELMESILGFAYTSICQILPASLWQSPLIHFLSCSGISRSTASFLDGPNFSQILAAIIYGARLLVYYRLSLFDWNPDDDEHTLYSTLEAIHSKFLHDRANAPAGEILSLLAYALKKEKGILSSDHAAIGTAWDDAEEGKGEKRRRVNFEEVENLVEEMKEWDEERKGSGWEDYRGKPRTKNS
ncbi:hypothetical protein BDZ91DRAFT_713778 [Kalaharituber pfeilii]|nr:hypothetical protein BDZ91DRAFT_713778 [Kalaharituber pfeilii]